MARPRTGQLINQRGLFYARVTTVIEGVKVRKLIALGTRDKLVAKRRLERLNGEANPTSESGKRAETFAEAAERVYAARKADGSEYADEDLKLIRKRANPIIGEMSVLELQHQPASINSVLDAAKADGLGRQSVQNLKQKISGVFARLLREPDGPTINPVAKVSMPDFPKRVVKERAVLNDAEFAIYLAWEHPKEGFRDAVRERQTMACVARMFGGLRTGDLHALGWDAFDVEAGGFAWGFAPRKKTRRPQLLEVPELLRPILRAWWEQHGRPKTGPVFPVRKLGRLGDRVGERRGRVSHAKRFRHDLQRALLSAAARDLPGACGPGSRRWRELFEETEYTLPIDFHSWRRAYAQALADADVNAQQAAALAGHADLGAHMRYLRNAGKMRSLPDAALPDLSAVGAKPMDQAPELRGNDGATPKGNMHVLTRLETSAEPWLAADSGALLIPESERTQLRNRGSKVRIFPAAQENRVSATVEQEQTATAMPKPAEATAIPARPAVRLIDLLAAIDAAAVAGELHTVRSLVAEATIVERRRIEPSVDGARSK